MKRFYFTAAIIAILLLVFAFSSCKTVKNTAEANIDKKDEVTCTPIVLDTNAAYSYTESDPFLLIGAELKGKCVEIEVEYSGGCGGDVWTLAWNGMLMKSLPPKANIYLHLKDNDACREVIRKKLSFDISSIYSKEVVLLLRDFRGVLTYMPE